METGRSGQIEGDKKKDNDDMIKTKKRERAEKMLRGYIQERGREKNTDKLCGEMQCWFEMTASSLWAGSSNPPHPTPVVNRLAQLHYSHTATADIGCSPLNALCESSHRRTQADTDISWSFSYISIYEAWLAELVEMSSFQFGYPDIFGKFIIWHP